MIKCFETFDNYVNPTTMVASGWTFPSLTVLPTGGRGGTRALFGAGFSFNAPVINRACNRLVVGLAIRPPLSGDGLSPLPSYAFTNSDKCYTPDNLAVVTFQFYRGTYLNFTITMRMAQPSYYPFRPEVWFTFATAGSGYPTIANSDVCPVPLLDREFTFIEAMVDVTDYLNGQAKAAINGDTVADRTGIITANHTGFGSDPYDPRAKLDKVVVTLNNYSRSSGTTYYVLDTFYLADDEGGYHNNFLGPAFSMPLYPAADGTKANWTPYINSTVVEDADRYPIIGANPFDPASEVDYIQADQDRVEEMIQFGQAIIPDESEIIAVNHRTAARGVASPGNPPPNSLVPLFAAVGNPVIEVPAERKKISGWTYQFLDVYYNIVPGFAIPWTALLIEESEFGFLLQEPIWNPGILEEIGITDEVIDE